MRHLTGVPLFATVVSELDSKDIVTTPFHEIFQMLGPIDKPLALK